MLALIVERTGLSTVPSTCKVLSGNLSRNFNGRNVVGILFAALTLTINELVLVRSLGLSLGHVEFFSTVSEVLTVCKSEYTVVVLKRNHISIRGKIHHDTVAIKNGDTGDLELAKSGVLNDTTLTVLINDDYEGVLACIVERTGLSTVPGTCKVLSADLCGSLNRSVVVRIGLATLALAINEVVLVLSGLCLTCDLDHCKVSTLSEAQVEGLLSSKSEGTVVVYKVKSTVLSVDLNMVILDSSGVNVELATLGVANSTLAVSAKNHYEGGFFAVTLIRITGLHTVPDTLKVLKGRSLGNLDSIGVTVVRSITYCTETVYIVVTGSIRRDSATVYTHRSASVLKVLVILGVFLTALHTSTGLTALKVPVEVAACLDYVGFLVTANGAASIVATVGSTGSEYVLFILISMENILNLLFRSAAKSTGNLDNTVGHGRAIGSGDDLRVYVIPLVTVRIDLDLKCVVVTAVNTLHYSGTGSAAGSCFKLRMSPEVLLILVCTVVRILCATNGTDALDVVVSDNIGLICNVAVATSTNVGGVTSLGTGGSSYDRAVGVTKSCNVSALVRITACAGVNGVTSLGTGRSSYICLIGVTKSRSSLDNLLVTARTNVSGVARLSTGGSSNYCLIGVTKSSSLVCLVAVATSTGVSGVTSLSTGRSSYNCLIVVYVGGYVVGILCAALALAINVAVLVGNVIRIFFAAGTLAVNEAVSESFALSFTTLAGCGSGTGCIAKYVHMLVSTDDTVKTGNLLENVNNFIGKHLKNLAGSKGEDDNSNCKHKQYFLQKVCHFSNVLSFFCVFHTKIIIA